MTAATAVVPSRRDRVASRWVLAGLIVLAVALVAMLVQRQLPFSPYDEYVYFDYLAKVPTQGMVLTGEEVGDVARAAIECRGVVGFGPYGDGCGVGGVDDDALFPYHGLTGADLYTPLYFGITWVAAQPFTWVGMDLLDAGRMAGGLWLAGAVALLFLALRRLGVSLAPAASLVVLALATPVVQSAFGYISTDAAAITAGAALAYVTARVVTGGASAWWLVPVGVLAVLGKVQAIGALGAALLVVAVHALVVRGGWRERGAWLRTILPAAVAGVAALAAQLVWSSIRSATAVGPGANLAVGAPELPPDELLRQLAHVLVHVGATRPTEPQASMTIAVAIATALACAGIVAGLLGLRGPHDRETGIARSWSIGTLTLALVMIPVLTLMTFVLEGTTFSPPLRYGAALLPFLLVSAGLLLARSRWLALGVGVVSLVLAALAWS